MNDKKEHTISDALRDLYNNCDPNGDEIITVKASFIKEYFKLTDEELKKFLRP